MIFHDLSWSIIVFPPFPQPSIHPVPAPSIRHPPGARAGAHGVPVDPPGATPGSPAPVPRWPGGGERLRALGTADLPGTRGVEVAGEGELRIPPGRGMWGEWRWDWEEVWVMGGRSSVNISVVVSFRTMTHAFVNPSHASSFTLFSH